MTEHNDNLFWEFSLGFYAEGEAAKLLLELQDEYGCQINMLLWCLWLGKRRCLVSSDNMTMAIDLLCEHQEDYVLPMRNLRRKFKAHPEEALYQQAKALELALEKWEQDRLFAISLEFEPDPASINEQIVAASNIGLYMERLFPSGATRSGCEAKLEALLQKLIG